jgi:hypothetical protein
MRAQYHEEQLENYGAIKYQPENLSLLCKERWNV